MSDNTTQYANNSHASTLSTLRVARMQGNQTKAQCRNYRDYIIRLGQTLCDTEVDGTREMDRPQKSRGDCVKEDMKNLG